MKDFFLQTLMGGAGGAAQGEGAAQGGLSGVMSFLPFVLIIGIFYFLIIRPQNKKQKETQKMLSALKKGDKVVTIGGVIGVIASTDGNEVVLKVDDNTKIKFQRSAISNVLSPREEKESAAIEKTGDKAEKKEADAESEAKDA